MFIKFIFNKIYVVESLFDGDWKTGSDLFNDNLRWKKIQDPSLEIDYISLTTKEEFFAFLNKVHDETRTIGAYPIIHLEIHGSKDKKGLILKSHELVTWHEVKPELTKINIAAKNNLFLVLAVCHGAHLMQIIKPSERSPFWGLIGPDKSVQAKDVAPSFSAFYDELLTSFDGSKAFKKLNYSFQSDDFDRYGFLNSQQIFKRCYKYYLKELCTPEAIRMRVEKIVEKVRQRTNNYNGMQDLENFVRTNVESKLMREPRYSFNSYKSRFFMFDLYPENRDRFKIEVDDLLN